MPKRGDQERTEPATEKKRREARKKGQVARSREVPSVVILLGCAGLFYFKGAWMVQRVSALMTTVFSETVRSSLEPSAVAAHFGGILGQVFIVVAPLLAIVTAAAVAGNIVQIGPLFTLSVMAPKLSKLDPLQGLSRIFSLNSLVELVKSVLKLVVVAVVGLLVVRAELDSMPSLVVMNAAGLLSYLGQVSFKITLLTCLVLVVIAGFDYVYQRLEHEKKLRMTKQEVKEELKQREGDQLVKGRIRKAQREMAQRRMMEDVPTADAVITNPVHLAVAVKYDASLMHAPRVVAKGGGVVAERIKEIARRHGVPVLENKALAQMLFKLVDVGAFVPVELYKAVAEILAYVYKLKGMGGGGGN